MKRDAASVSDELAEADRIAVDFAAIPFPDHEARKLAFAYLRLRLASEIVSEDVEDA